MKKILVLILTLTLCLGMFGFTTISASAQEDTQTTEQTTESNLPSTDEVIDNLTNGSHISEEDKQLIKDLVEKVKGYTENSDSFFIKYIVPLIVAAVLCLCLGLILFLPYFKAKGETRTLKKMLTNSKDMINELKAEMENLRGLVDVEKLEEDIQNYLVKHQEASYKIIQETLAKNGVEISKIEAMLLAIKEGAINAWQGSPEAIACLTKNADAQVLDDVIKENAKLKAYIVETSGEKALKDATV